MMKLTEADRQADGRIYMMKLTEALLLTLEKNNQ
jgi:hypothetical protein